MPYHIKKVKGGWKVGKRGDAKTFSKRPLTRAMALRQLRALMANERK